MVSFFFLVKASQLSVTVYQYEIILMLYIRPSPALQFHFCNIQLKELNRRDRCPS
jgi:hypothetical protein